MSEIPFSVDARPPRRETPVDLLLLAYWFPPVNESGALRPARFCRYLPDLGYSPWIVAASNSPVADLAPQVLRAPEIGARGMAAGSVTRLFRGLQRVVPYSDCLEWVPHAVASARSLIQAKPMGVIVSTSPPVATHVAALWLNLQYGLPWVADFRDPLVGNPFRTKWRGRLYDTALEHWIMRRTAAVVVNTDAAQDELARRFPAFRQKIHLIWNGFDGADSIGPAPLPVRSYRVVAHFGSIYGGRHPGRLVTSLRRLFDRGALDERAFRLRLVGSIDRSEGWIRASAFSEFERRGSAECTDGTVPRAEAQRQMAESDFLLLLDVNQLEIGLQVPGKLFEYVRIGRPILAFTSNDSPVNRILGKSGVPHVCVFPEDVEAEVDRKVMELLSTSTEPVQPSEWFLREFDAKCQTASLAQILSDVVRKRR
jgi:hypothetical protein